MKNGANLLIFNYVMDSTDPLLSHQYEAVAELSVKFNEITVITGRIGVVEKDASIRIISSDWAPGHRIRSVLRLLRVATPIILRGNYSSVFFHMTDVQAAILSPLIRLRHRRQYLWYAHTYKSSYLRWASTWVSGIITSTVGSCPIKGDRVIPIGQAIDESKFPVLPFEKLKLDKLIHIGRFDKSKNIDLLVSEFKDLRKLFPEISLTLVGNSSNSESHSWAKKLINDNRDYVDEAALTFRDAILRSQFPDVLAENGCFFHAYTGSLDKTLIESTMMRVPVLTINPEYLSIFGSWSKRHQVSLRDEYKALRSLSAKEMQGELERRLTMVKEKHSLVNWINQLNSLLK